MCEKAIPEIAKKHGMTRLVFEDDFDSLGTIDLNATGEEGFKWYVRRPYGGVTLTTEDFSIEDSVLKLHERNSRFNYGLATVDPVSGVGYTFNKGVLEFRVRVPHYDQSMRSSKLPGGGGPAVWSFPREKIVDRVGDYAPQWVETDWMEYWGDVELFPEGHYSITLHETIREVKDGVVIPNRVQGHSLGEERHQSGFRDALWHTMTFLWDDDLFVGYFDDNEVLRMNYGEGKLCDPIPTVVCGEQMMGAFSFMNRQQLALIINGSACNPMEIDWIRVWQK
jgi:hypothetical protein